MLESEQRALLGELIMPRLNIDDYSSDEQYADSIRYLAKNGMAGGFCIFGGSPNAVADIIIELQGIAASTGSLPFLFSCDCEFGLPMRLAKGGTEFPDAMAIAKTGEPELAFKSGQAIAREMRAIGLSWNFAPVADVNSNPKNPIINTRSFGEDPDTVAEYATAFMLGLQSEGVVATAKHFPGHGDTDIDSHRKRPVIERSWESFEDLELPPFRALIRCGVSTVMTGHLAAPKLAAYFGANVQEQHLPATLSAALTTRLLRERLGFEGVIVTDALEMRAITEYFGADEAALFAFEAGADILLLTPDPLSTFNALVQALELGRISIEDVNKRVDRIRKLKLMTHLAIDSVHPERLAEYAAEHSVLSEEIARKAIKIRGNLRLDGVHIVILSDDRPEAIDKSKLFENLIRPFVSEVKVFTTKNWFSESANIGVDTILVTFHRARGYVDPVSERISVPTIIRAIATSSPEKGIMLQGLILFGSPYLDSEFETSPSFVMKTFSESTVSIFAAVERLKA